MNVAQVLKGREVPPSLSEISREEPTWKIEVLKVEMLQFKRYLTQCERGTDFNDLQQCLIAAFVNIVMNVENERRHHHVAIKEMIIFVFHKTKELPDDHNNSQFTKTLPRNLSAL
jgi:hypothetical protein